MRAIDGKTAIYGSGRWLLTGQRSETKAAPSAYHTRKQMPERIFAAGLLVLVSPLLAVLMLLVRLTSRGPALFSQMRVGRNGRAFRMYKIRTMRLDAEARSGPVWGLPHDPRATPIGRLFRSLHLDELPQLINVVKGEMSLIGPRPERPEFVPVLAAAISDYRDRLGVLPGITGLAQLNLPPDSDLNSVRRKLVLDCEYVASAGLWLDCRLLICTALRMFKLPESLVLRVLGVRRSVSLPTAANGRFDAGQSDAAYLGMPPSSVLLQFKIPSPCREKLHRRSSSARQGNATEAMSLSGISSTGKSKPR